MALIAAGALALEQGICRPGWVETSGGRIVGCGSGLPPRRADVDMPEALLVPLPGCGHVPMTDNPPLVADVLLRGSGRA